MPPTSTTKKKTAAAPAKRRQPLAPQERSGPILDFAAKLISEEGLTELSM